MVEDVCLFRGGGAAGAWVRRLVFEANRSLVQSEAALAEHPAGPPTPSAGPCGPPALCAEALVKDLGAHGALSAGAAGARKKKGKKTGGGAPPQPAGGESGSAACAVGAPLRPICVDHSVLCSAYHAAIVSGLALIGTTLRW